VSAIFFVAILPDAAEFIITPRFAQTRWRLLSDKVLMCGSILDPHGRRRASAVAGQCLALPGEPLRPRGCLPCEHPATIPREQRRVSPDCRMALLSPLSDVGRPDS
jgi:hypothetical protein